MTAGWYCGFDMPTQVTLLGAYTNPGTDSIKFWGAYQSHEGINRLMDQRDLSENGELYSENGELYFCCQDRTADVI